MGNQIRSDNGIFFDAVITHAADYAKPHIVEKSTKKKENLRIKIIMINK